MNTCYFAFSNKCHIAKCHTMEIRSPHTGKHDVKEQTQYARPKSEG